MEIHDDRGDAGMCTARPLEVRVKRSDGLKIDAQPSLPLRKQMTHVFLLITKIVTAFYVYVENNHMENYL